MPLSALTDLLRRLDLALSELAALQHELRAYLPAPAAEGNGPDAASDFAPEHMIEISTAVERFNRPADSLRWMCRKQGCGQKIGGRWLLSEPRARRWLNGGE